MPVPSSFSGGGLVNLRLDAAGQLRVALRRTQNFVVALYRQTLMPDRIAHFPLRGDDEVAGVDFAAGRLDLRRIGLADSEDFAGSPGEGRQFRRRDRSPVPPPHPLCWRQRR
jgi:hypothetical protein